MAANRSKLRSQIVTVRPKRAKLMRQHLPSFVGIASTTTGARGLSMNLVTIPPGASAEPHLHRGFETAIYLIKGRVRTRYGVRLERSVINRTGDFVFIPADLPHQATNLSKTESALAVVARNDPNEQESVQIYVINAEGALKRRPPGRTSRTSRSGLPIRRRS